jgi:hypothetical protein
VIIKRRVGASIPAASSSKILQNLCLDKGYDFQEIEDEAVKRGYVPPHIRHRGEETLLAMTKKYSNHHPAIEDGLLWKE